MALSVQAQTSKPTKEETIRFIKDYYEDKSFTCLERELSTVQTKTSDKVAVDFNSVTNIMTLSWVYTFRFTNSNDHSDDQDQVTQYKLTIDFSKVEAVSLTDVKGGNCVLSYASLKATSGEKLELFERNYTKLHNKSSLQDERTETVLKKEAFLPIESNEGNIKIIKAFNHLRKLCGAPDPISFD